MFDFRILRFLHLLTQQVPNFFHINRATWVFIENDTVCTIILSNGLIDVIGNKQRFHHTMASIDYIRAAYLALQFMYKNSNANQYRYRYREIYESLNALHDGTRALYETFIEKFQTTTVSEMPGVLRSSVSVMS